MSSLDDKILGIKKHYYCDSSESEGESDSETDKDNKNFDNVQTSKPQEPSKWEGSSKNTGPKGVIRDWQLYKQLENEKKSDLDLQKIELAKKLTLSTSQIQKEDEDEVMNELMSDDFLLQYQKQRMEEMLLRPLDLPKFGTVLNLRDGNEFLDAVDNENKSVTVIVHIFVENNKSCRIMNNCLNSLSKQYPSVKFCKINGSSAGMSHRFKMDGVPALLVYKEGSVIGNFVRITDELGEEFYDSDVENFLIEHGILNDPYCIPVIMQAEEEENGESDWSLD